MLKVYVINAFHCILQLTKQAEQNRRLHYLYILDVNVNSVTALVVENREKSSGVSKLLSSSVRNNKQLLDEVFVISGIIKVKVTVIRLRLITLTETLIIPDIAKTESSSRLLYVVGTGKQNNGKHLCPSRLPASERFFP